VRRRTGHPGDFAVTGRANNLDQSDQSELASPQ
jgi:hypothetical protein